MATGLPRARRHSSPLVRALTELSGAEVADPALSLGERLGQWLPWTSAIALSNVLDGAASNPAPRLRARPGDVAPALAREIAGVRAALARAIANDALLAAPPDAAPAGAPDFTPYRRCYLAHQAAMEARIAPLRARLRAALAQRSAALGRLAQLDRVMDEALAARERQALAGVPGLLAQRHKQLPAAPAALAAYHHGLQRVLQAELALRLQPVEGMMQALSQADTEDAPRP